MCTKTNEKNDQTGLMRRLSACPRGLLRFLERNPFDHADGQASRLCVAALVGFLHTGPSSLGGDRDNSLLTFFVSVFQRQRLETGEVGWEAVEGKIHVDDLYATIVHRLVREGSTLAYRNNGREFRSSSFEGNVLKVAVA